MKKNKIKRLIVLMLVSALGMSLTGCAGDSVSTQTNSANSELTITESVSSETLSEISEQKSTVSEVNVTKQSQQLRTTGIIRARELGGYPAANGKKIKRGVLAI